MKKPSATDPQLLEMPAQKFAVVRSHGDPNTAAEQALSALYGSVFTLKFALKKSGQPDFKVTGLRARWPDIHLAPKDEWLGIWGLPIPADTTVLPQKSAEVEVVIEDWSYGTVAQILHLGPYTTESESVERLLAFIDAQGYEIAGDHEEEYLTRPNVKEPKTIIRYPVRRRS